MAVAGRETEFGAVLDPGQVGVAAVCGMFLPLPICSGKLRYTARLWR